MIILCYRECFFVVLNFFFFHKELKYLFKTYLFCRKQDEEITTRSNCRPIDHWKVLLVWSPSRPQAFPTSLLLPPETPISSLWSRIWVGMGVEVDPELNHYNKPYALCWRKCQRPNLKKIFCKWIVNEKMTALVQSYPFSQK